MTSLSGYWGGVRTQVLANLERTSRTAQTGTIDVSVSEGKVGGTVDRADVRQRVLVALDFLRESLPTQPPSGELVQRLLDGVAARVQGTSAPSYRTHAVTYGRRIPPKEVEVAVHAFCHELARRLASDVDPIATAAWAEHEIDRAIHPYADGCGRTSKLVAVLVLAPHRVAPPAYPNRDVYYSALEGNMLEPKSSRREAVDVYLATRPDLAVRLAEASTSLEVFEACYREWIASGG